MRRALGLLLALLVAAGAAAQPNAPPQPASPAAAKKSAKAPAVKKNVRPNPQKNIKGGIIEKEAEHYSNAGLVQQIVDVVGPTQVNLVAATDDSAYRQASVVGVVQECECQAAALGHDRHRARP